MVPELRVLVSGNYAKWNYHIPGKHDGILSARAGEGAIFLIYRCMSTPLLLLPFSLTVLSRYIVGRLAKRKTWRVYSNLERQTCLHQQTIDGVPPAPLSLPIDITITPTSASRRLEPCRHNTARHR